jgi:hypothetical protein
MQSVRVLGRGASVETDVPSLCVACTAQLNVTISFGGRAWPISNDDMILPTSNPDICYGAIIDLDLQFNLGGPPMWIIGDTFLVRGLACGGLKSAALIE